MLVSRLLFSRQQFQESIQFIRRMVADDYAPATCLMVLNRDFRAERATQLFFHGTDMEVLSLIHI